MTHYFNFVNMFHLYFNKTFLVTFCNLSFIYTLTFILLFLQFICFNCSSAFARILYKWKHLLCSCSICSVISDSSDPFRKAILNSLSIISQTCSKLRVPELVAPSNHIWSFTVPLLLM